MFALLATLLLAINGSVVLLTAGLMLLVALLLLQVFLPQADLAQIILFCLMGLSIPTAALIASTLIEKVALAKSQCKSLTIFCFVLTSALCLQSTKLADYLQAAVNILNAKSPLAAIILVTSISQNCLTAAAMVALAVLSLQVLFEVPAIWFCSAFGLTRKPQINFEGVRIIATITIVLIASQPIVSYLSSKLWPQFFVG